LFPGNLLTRAIQTVFICYYFTLGNGQFELGKKYFYFTKNQPFPTSKFGSPAIEKSYLKL